MLNETVAVAENKMEDRKREMTEKSQEKDTVQ